MAERPIADVVIAGAGIVGLSVGLELRRRGVSVVVLEKGHAMRAASWAAGGMLAARDPENPPALLQLSLRSLELYPEYLERVGKIAGRPVPLRTRKTLQQVSGPAAADDGITFEEAQSWIPGLANTGRRFAVLEEESLDPRDLCRALPRAFLAEQGTLLEDTAVLGLQRTGSGIAIETARERIYTGVFVNCCGAWAGEPLGDIPVEPVKGQAVTVALAPERLRCVLRAPEFYAIPRGDGRVTIGATIERAGFNDTVEEHRIAALLRTASRLLPELSDGQHLESWAGLRPGTPDGLPILGNATVEHCWHATGHYRNGVLLAPVTAHVIAQAILGEPPDVPLHAFRPNRFASAAASFASGRSHTAVAESARLAKSVRR